jgi:hypothetical protein
MSRGRKVKYWWGCLTLCCMVQVLGLIPIVLSVTFCILQQPAVEVSVFTVRVAYVNVTPISLDIEGGSLSVYLLEFIFCFYC